MKKVLSSSVLIFLTLLLVGCHKGLKRDIRNIKCRLDQIENIEIGKLEESLKAWVNSTIDTKLSAIIGHMVSICHIPTCASAGDFAGLQIVGSAPPTTSSTSLFQPMASTTHFSLKYNPSAHVLKSLISNYTDPMEVDGKLGRWLLGTTKYVTTVAIIFIPFAGAYFEYIRGATKTGCMVSNGVRICGHLYKQNLVYQLLYG